MSIPISMLLVAALIVSGASSARANCLGSQASVGENIPAGTTDDGHSVVHIAAILLKSQVAGWLYEDQDGSEWIQAASKETVSTSDAEWLLSLAGRPPGPPVAGSYFGAQTMMRGPLPLDRLAGKTIEIQSCV